MFNVDRKEIAEFLIKKGANVNYLDVNGETPLHMAATSGNLENE